jgi:hypothetical protein
VYGRQSLLRAVSGADGAVAWDLSGGEAGEGAETWAMDVRTGMKESLGQDVGFGRPLLVCPDRDGDGVPDIAALVDFAAGDGTHPAVLIVTPAPGNLAPHVFHCVDRQSDVQSASRSDRLVSRQV